MKTAQQWREVVFSEEEVVRGFPFTVFNVILADMEELERQVEELANENRGLEAYIAELSERRGHE